MIPESCLIAASRTAGKRGFFSSTNEKVVEDSGECFKNFGIGPCVPERISLSAKRHDQDQVAEYSMFVATKNSDTPGKGVISLLPHAFCWLL